MDTTGAGKQVEDWEESRRFRALKLREEGWLQEEIAEAPGVTQSAVSQWLSRAWREGPEALHNHFPPEPTPRLTEAQRAQLPSLLERGAEAFRALRGVYASNVPRAAAAQGRANSGTGKGAFSLPISAAITSGPPTRRSSGAKASI